MQNRPTQPVITSQAPEQKLDTKRPLGLGFGLGITFLIFYLQQLRILINPAAIKNIASKREALQQWIVKHKNVKATSDIDSLIGKDDITGVLNNEKLLGEIINDILDDRSVIQLSKRLPFILQNLDDDVKVLFSKTETLERFHSAYLKSWENYANLHAIMKKRLKKRADLPNKPNHPLGTFNFFLDKLQLQNQDNFPGKLPEPTDDNFIEEMRHILSTKNITRINPTLMATLIPIVLYYMDEVDRAKIAVEIAKRLPPKYFQIVAEENYSVFKQTENHDELLNASIDTTGRAIVFRPQNDSVTSIYQYRGETLKLNHVHIHFELEGEESEYSLYQSAEALALEMKKAQDGMPADSNNKVAGEVHIVLERTSSAGHQRLMAIGFVMKMNSDPDYKGNPEIAKLLEQYEREQEISFNIQKAFMPNLDKAQDHNLVIDSNWASTESPTHAFQAGLRFLVVLPDDQLKTSVEVSQSQYEKLREIFNHKNYKKFAQEDIDPEIKMIKLSSTQGLHPYGRSPSM